jgi:aspartyl-tRNA synthetase
LGLIKQGVFEFLWVVDFPYFEWDEEEKKIIYGEMILIE